MKTSKTMDMGWNGGTEGPERKVVRMFGGLQGVKSQRKQRNLASWG